MPRASWPSRASSQAPGRPARWCRTVSRSAPRRWRWPTRPPVLWCSASARTARSGRRRPCAAPGRAGGSPPRPRPAGRWPPSRREAGRRPSSTSTRTAEAWPRRPRPARRRERGTSRACPARPHPAAASRRPRTCCRPRCPARPARSPSRPARSPRPVPPSRSARRRSTSPPPARPASRSTTARAGRRRLFLARGQAVTGASAYPVAYQPMQLFLSGAAGAMTEDSGAGAPSGTWTTQALPATSGHLQGPGGAVRGDAGRRHGRAQPPPRRRAFPAGQVTTSFATAWDDTLSGGYLVICRRPGRHGRAVLQRVRLGQPVHRHPGIDPVLRRDGPLNALPRGRLRERGGRHRVARPAAGHRPRLLRRPRRAAAGCYLRARGRGAVNACSGSPS